VGFQNRPKKLQIKRHEQSLFFIAFLIVVLLSAVYLRIFKNNYYNITEFFPYIIMTIILLLLLLVLCNLRQSQIHLREKSKALAMQESLYRNVFERAPIGIALLDNRDGFLQEKFISINPMGESILGRDIANLKTVRWPDITHPDDLPAELEHFQRFSRGEIDSYYYEKRYLRPDSSIIWVKVKIADFSAGAFCDSMFLCLIEDISERKASEAALSESERSKAVFLSSLQGMAYRCLCDQQYTMEFVSEGCLALTGYEPLSFINNRDLSFGDIVAPEFKQWLRNEWDKALTQRIIFRADYEIVTKSGIRKWVQEHGQGVFDADGNIEALEGIIFDITEQKKQKAQIVRLSEHDFLTGLYNRVYMNKKMKWFDQPGYWPLTIMICDIDGLRMVNDAYGYDEGDRLINEAGCLLQEICQDNDVIGRLSGGEFMLLLPDTDNETARQIIQKIDDNVNRYNQAQKQSLYKMSLTIGYGIKDSYNQSLEETLKTADKYIKNRKLINQNSAHSAIVSSIMATLYAKSQETEKHGQRLSSLCLMIGEHLGLEQKELDDLQLLSILHDIGKIGVDDSILNKPGKLTEEEWVKMKQHPIIGHRIAMATPQLEHIAEYILYHHEHWDGAGYPQGKKGLEIPLLSRILALADAFDAMTEDRLYRKAMPLESALEEIKICAGIQFDPEIAQLFIELISNQQPEA